MQLFKPINTSVTTLSLALIKQRGHWVGKPSRQSCSILNFHEKKQEIIKFFHPFNLITELNEMMLRKLRWNHSINLRGRWGGGRSTTGVVAGPRLYINMWDILRFLEHFLIPPLLVKELYFILRKNKEILS